MLKLITRLVLSPVVLFVAGYIYYGTTKEAYHLALLGYTILVVFSLIYTGLTIIPTISKFNILKLVRKGYKTTTMLIALGLYWLIYLIFWA